MDLKAWLNFYYVKIVFIFCTSGIVLSQHECSPGLFFPGYTIPHGDILIEYGHDLNIMCVLHNKNGSNSSRYLTFNRNNKTIPPEMIKIVNSTAIELHISKPPKVSMDTYTCLLNNTIPVCMNHVTVGTKPQDVTDFNCISYNYDNLTCTWTPPKNYVKTNYNLTYSLYARSSRHIMACPFIKQPDIDDPHMSCFWNVSTTPQYRSVHEELYFTLTMVNDFGTNVLNKTINHFAHVLSGPPENLTLINATASSLYLYWTIPRSMRTFSPGVHHRILYQCVFSKDKWYPGGLLKDQKDHAVYFNLTDLPYAYALYDIRVSLRSAKALPDDESMWSQNASITERTTSKIPDEPPKTDIGSFEIVASGSSLQYREAYIYWQQIPEEQKNGRDFRYEVSVEGNSNIQPVNITNAYAKFINLSVAESYVFNIWSANIKGRSIRKSRVYVPKVTDRINEPLSFTKVELGDGIYELTWEAPKLPPQQYITNYTIFLCDNNGKDKPYQCVGMLNWTVVSNTTTSYNGSIAKDKIFQFAISANTENGSSGMLWAACTVIHNKNTGKMKNVWINRLGSTFIEVSWKLDCSDRIGSVEGYTIKYCPIISPNEMSCKGSEKNVTIEGDGSILGGNITNLQPYTTYMLDVIVKHTTFSQQSDALYNTTLEEAPSSPPQNLRIKNITNSSVSLSWEPPTAINGKLKYYIIEYDNREVKHDQNNLTITDLNSYETYFISISACTVRCSEKSKPLNVTTLMGYPGQIRKPTVDRRNDSTITIVWNKPTKPNGLNEYYTVQFKQKHKRENRTLQFNVTDRKYVIENCGDGGKFNTFYISVRAVNIINNTSHEGPWSEELENYCDTPINYLMYILSILVIVFFIGMAVLFNRLYKHYKIMRDVEVKLPPGLAPVVTDHTLVPWNTENHRENRDSHSPPDEELLLNKLSEGRHLSGDSSGCSSGHESVTSSLGSGTHVSSSSDSGTEQQGSHSVLGLGIESKMESSYIPVATDMNKVPYKTCDVSNESSPYVMTGDAVKTINPGYIPFNQTEPIEKSAGYVVAGIKNCSGYIPFNQTETVNRNSGYVVAGIKNCKLD